MGLWDWLRGWFGGAAATPETGPSARELMQQMREERRAGPADDQAWREGLATLKSRVFSPNDRARLWRRARRVHPGDVVDLDAIRAPTRNDQQALDDLLRELDRA